MFKQLKLRFGFKPHYRIKTDGTHYYIQQLLRSIIWPFWRTWATYSQDFLCVGFHWPSGNRKEWVQYSSYQQAQSQIDDFLKEQTKPKGKLVTLDAFDPRQEPDKLFPL